MTTRRWFWPGILTIPAAGLAVQEIWTFYNLHLGEDRPEQIRSAAAWGLWVALPYLVVAVQMGIAARRNRAAWWTSLAAGVVVTLAGLAFAALAVTDDSGDPLVGLYWVLGPLVQLSAAVPAGAVVLILTLAGRRTAPPPVTT